MATNTATSGGGGAGPGPGVFHGGNNNSSSSHYDVLGINRTSTSDEIKKAYRKLSLRWHPDKNPANCAEAKRRFNDISTAYQILSNMKQRSLYDRRLMTRASGLNGDCTDGRPTVNGDTSVSAAATDVDNEDFILRDPRAVFHDFFGGRDPFSEGFGIPVSDELTAAGVGDGSISNCVSPPIFRRISIDSDCAESMPKSCCGSSFSTNTNTTTVKSVATSTRFVHGKKIVTRKVVENGQETTTIEEDGELKSKTVNGVAVLLPSQEAASSNGTSTVTEPQSPAAATGTDHDDNRLSTGSAASAPFVKTAAIITDPLLNNCVESR